MVPATIHSGSTLMSAISSVSSNRVHRPFCSGAASFAARPSPRPLSRWRPRIETNSAIRAGRPLRLGWRSPITRNATTPATRSASTIIVIGELQMRLPIDGWYGAGDVSEAGSAGVR